MKKVLVIDNYDSFTYNLVHILRELGLSREMEIVRNDQFDINHVEDFQNILLSPGPGIPSQAGLMPQVIKKYAPEKNILGVCLGHQGIGEVFGAKLYNLPVVFHGVTTQIKVEKEEELFHGIPTEFRVCRYHSWVIDRNDLPECLIVTSVDPEGIIMSVKHRDLKVRGVQFHPESIMTEYGKKMIDNWLQIGE